MERSESEQYKNRHSVCIANLWREKLFFFFSGRYGNIHLEFTHKVELDSNVFLFRTVFNIDIGEVIALALKYFPIPFGGMEDCDGDVEISVSVKLELIFSVCLGITNKGISGFRAKSCTFLNFENKSR